MTELKHTPAPWTRRTHRRDGARHGGFWIDGPSEDRRSLVKVTCYSRRTSAGYAEEDMAESEANACLIEAAPDLLAACEAVVAAVDDAHWMSRLTADQVRSMTDACRGAIKKAKGGA